VPTFPGRRFVLGLPERQQEASVPETALTVTLADYARIMPLVTRAVAPEGISLTVVTGNAGSWPERAALLNRALTDPAVDAGEGSMGQHLARIGRGDRRFIALPAFPLRNFTARDLYVARGSSLRTPRDLIGKRVGMYSWTASGSIWYRHFLRWCGVQPQQIQWLIGDVDVPQISQAGGDFPPHVRAVPPGRPLSEMLLEGEIDALYSPPRPLRFHPTEGPIIRLIDDIRGTEARYFAETGVYPPQHLVVMRREVWERDKTLARRLTDAFIRNNAYFEAQQRSFPYVTPWQELENDSLPPGIHADGLEANRRAMELFCEMGHALGLTPRPVSVDEYFAEYLASA
jgi:4,5-dihydroxyphthalate decarboxylase